MTATEQELDLVNQAVAGDPEALQAVIRLWGPRVRRFAGRLCPATEVLDAVQETLFILADRIGTLRAAEALTSWSFQVVKRQCLKAFSQLRRDTALARTLGVMDEDPASQEPSRQLLIGELGRVLSILPRTDSEILTLRDLEGLSSREAAQRLGVVESVIKSRLHRARTRLRKMMLASPLVRSVQGI
jgi:RNA polymerase sigma-70 factor (ECF subfamily)